MAHLFLGVKEKMLDAAFPVTEVAGCVRKLASIAGYGPSRHAETNAPLDDAMPDYPQPLYSHNQVVKAGKALKRRGLMYETPEQKEMTREVFRIAYNWRSAHAFPMRSIRYDLSGKVRRVQKQGGVTAGRLKRMQSVRKKLDRLPVNLLQIDDLGGCRAVVNSMAEVDALLAFYRDGVSQHAVRLDRSYISEPKPSGYRSHHLVFLFQGNREEEDIYNGLRVEVQIRTHLQHAWATTVEAVGMLLGQDLKAGEGSLLWLRLFQLMSSEFAEIEGYPLVPDTPTTQAGRKAELADLNRRIAAVSSLEAMNEAIIDPILFKRGDADNYYMIQFDTAMRKLSVSGYTSRVEGADKYSQEEIEHAELDTVLVEVDKVQDLKLAYPNYYWDVRSFTTHLKDLLGLSRPTLKHDHLSWVRHFVKRRPGT
jgi:hypothetical protein